MDGKVYLNRYRLRVDQLGLPIVMRRTANEATFEADDLEAAKQVALQVVPLTALRNSARAELEAEAQAARQLKHINIPLLRDFGFEGGQVCYVTRFFEGTTAEDWVKTKGAMPANVVLRIASQIASALGTASFHGLLHPAISPANILLVPGQTAEGEWPLIKLLNFLGGARALPGTSDFASPEEKAGHALDFRSQIYSLGKTLWFLLKGAPLSGGVAEVESAAEFPLPIRRLLALMLAEDPEARPFDPLAFEQQIQNYLTQTERREASASAASLTSNAEVFPAEGEFEIASRRPSVWKPLALAAALLAVAAIAAVLIADRVRPRLAVTVPIKEPTPAATAAPNELSSAAPEVLTSTASVADEEKAAASAPAADETPTPPAEEMTRSTPPPLEAAAPMVQTPTEREVPMVELSPSPTASVIMEEDVQKNVRIPSVEEAPATATPVARKTRTAAEPDADGQILRAIPAHPNQPNESSRPSSPTPSPRETRRRNPSPNERDPVKDLPILRALPPD